MSIEGLIGKGLSRRVSADSPVPYIGRQRTAFGSFGLGAPGDHARGALAEMEQYSEIGTLFGVVSTFATAVSLVNWRFFRKAKSGLEEDRVEIVESQAAPLKVWNKPNAFFSRQELVEGTQQHVDLTGEGWWVITRFAGLPVELWPVRPDRMFPVPSREDFIAGYVYVSPDGELVPLAREDVIFIRWPSPLDIYRGQGPLPSLAGDLGNESAQRAWSESFFRNSALPGGVIKLDVRLGDAEFDELIERWNRSHRGISNAGRVAVLEQGDFISLAYNQREMQFVETRGLTKQAILDAYGMPRFGIGDVQDVNRASAEASRAYIAEAKTVPRLERIKGALNNDFLPQFGPLWDGCEFDYDNPVPEDRETENATLTAKANAAKTLVDARFDPDEVCDAVGLPRMKFREPDPVVAPVIAPVPGQPKKVPA